MVDWIEEASSVNAGRILTDRRDKRRAARDAVEVDQRINKLLRDPRGVPDGKGKRTRLAGATLFPGPLPNRIRERGRPPDNAVFIFIDDIDRACRAAGLKPDLRYVTSVSLPVAIFIELAPIIWSGHPKNPRRVFERWQRLRSTLIRE